MPKNTIDLDMVKKKMEFVAKYSEQGDKVIIIVPKQYHDLIRKLKNPLLINAEEILE